MVKIECYGDRGGDGVIVLDREGEVPGNLYSVQRGSQDKPLRSA